MKNSYFSNCFLLFLSPFLLSCQPFYLLFLTLYFYPFIRFYGLFFGFLPCFYRFYVNLFSCFFQFKHKARRATAMVARRKIRRFFKRKSFFRLKRFIKNFRIYFLQTAFRFYRFMNNFSPSESTVISLSGATSLIIISFASIVSTVWSINLLSGLAPKFTS